MFSDSDFQFKNYLISLIGIMYCINIEYNVYKYNHVSNRGESREIPSYNVLFSKNALSFSLRILNSTMENIEQSRALPTFKCVS